MVDYLILQRGGPALSMCMFESSTNGLHFALQQQANRPSFPCHLHFIHKFLLLSNFMANLSHNFVMLCCSRSSFNAVGLKAIVDCNSSPGLGLFAVMTHYLKRNRNRRIRYIILDVVDIEADVQVKRFCSNRKMKKTELKHRRPKVSPASLV